MAKDYTTDPLFGRSGKGKTYTPPAPTKKQRQADQILRHGLALRRQFCNNDLSVFPTMLCKALRRIETKGNRLATDYCNVEGFDPATLERHDKRTMKRLAELLPGLPAEAIHLNHDPRGYYLKIDDKYIRDNKIELYRDWGGYGIIAPEFTGDK